MAQIRVPHGLKRLQPHNMDPSYWRDLFEMTEEGFAEHAENVLDIVRRKWPSPQQLDRNNKDHMKQLSAHLRSTVDAISGSYLTTSAELDDLLVQHVAFALFLNQLEKDHENAQSLQLLERLPYTLPVEVNSGGNRQGQRHREANQQIGSKLDLSSMTCNLQSSQHNNAAIQGEDSPLDRIEETPSIELRQIRNQQSPSRPSINQTPNGESPAQTFPLYNVLAYIDEERKGEKNG